MFHPCFLATGALLSLVGALVAIETCPSTGMPGIPGIPGLPGRDGRDGHKGEKGEPGTEELGRHGPIKGERGEPGRMGHPGKRGQSGESGTAGLAGIPGIPGEPGDNGAAGIQPQAAFSVARATNEYPNKGSVVRFTKIITNINDDYDPISGHFRCRVPGTYYFVFHASLDERLCMMLKMDGQVLSTFCDHRRNRRQVTSGGLAVYLSKDQEVWLETKDYRGMRGKETGYSVFSGFLLSAH